MIYAVKKFVESVVDIKRKLKKELKGSEQGCQMAKFGPVLSLDCARVEGVGLLQSGNLVHFPSVPFSTFY